MTSGRSIKGITLGLGLLVGGLAWAQGDFPPPTQEGPAQPEMRGGTCPGGCPLCEAHASATNALEAGASVTLEETPNGAVLRFEAPAGDPEAIEAARSAAQSYARALQAPATERGCPCPHREQPPAYDDDDDDFYP
jgi:hypothetical protein